MKLKNNQLKKDPKKWLESRLRSWNWNESIASKLKQIMKFNSQSN